MDNPYSTFASGINNTVAANQFDPQALNREVAQDSKKAVFQQDLIKLISVEIMNKQRADMDNAVALAANVPEGTVADREVKKLTQTTESDVAKRIAAVDRQKAEEKNKRLAALTKGGPQGINGLDNSIPAIAAGNRGGLVAAAMHRPTTNYTRGGLVSFDNGGAVEGGDEELVEVDRGVAEKLYDLGSSALEGVADYGGLTVAGGYISWQMIKALGRSLVGGKLKMFVPNSLLKWGEQQAANLSDVTGVLPFTKEIAKRGLQAGVIGEAGREASNLFEGEEPEVVKPGEQPGEEPGEEPGGEPGGEQPGEQQDYRTPEEIAAAQAEIDAAAEQGERFQQNLTDITNQATIDRANLKTSADRAYDLGLKTIEAEEKGITSLETAQGVTRGDIVKAQGLARGDQQQVIDDIKAMAATARGGRRELFQDLVLGLSKAGQGKNVSEGLADSYQTIVDREAARDQTARGLDEKAISERKGLSALTLQGATDLANIDLNNQKDLTSARNALNSTIQSVAEATRDSDAQTIQLGMQINASTRDILRLMGDNKIKQASATSKAVLGKIAATQRLLSTEVLKAQGDKFRMDALSGAASGISDVITAIQYGEGPDRDARIADLQSDLVSIVAKIRSAAGVQANTSSTGQWSVEKD